MSSPPGSTVPALTAPLVPTRQGSVTTYYYYSLPRGPRPRASGGQNAAQRHASARARGCSTGGVWVRGGFPQQRRLGSKLHPSLQVLQHPATAGGQWGVVTPCHTARLTFSPRGPREEVPASGFRSHVQTNLPSARSPTQGLRGGRTAHGIPARGHVVAAQVGVWGRGGFPQQQRLGSKLHPSLQVLQHPATAGGQWGVVTPCHTARLTFSPRGPREGVPASGFRSLPSARSPTQGLRGGRTAHGIPARGHVVAAQVGVWGRGGFPQQRRLGSKLHPSLQVLQHPATAGGQWGVVTPCHTARLTFVLPSRAP